VVAILGEDLEDHVRDVLDVQERFDLVLGRS
jgi:hypothetical protein